MPTTRSSTGRRHEVHVWSKLPNLRLAILKLRLHWVGLTLVHGCEMAFRIRFHTGERPVFEFGPRGAELGCYIPAGTSWVQRNYGQGEGQVEINGREWGFYWPE